MLVERQNTSHFISNTKLTQVSFDKEGSRKSVGHYSKRKYLFHVVHSVVITDTDILSIFWNIYYDQWLWVKLHVKSVTLKYFKSMKVSCITKEEEKKTRQSNWSHVIKSQKQMQKCIYIKKNGMLNACASSWNCINRHLNRDRKRSSFLS